jgi:hypothetical protein
MAFVEKVHNGYQAIVQHHPEEENTMFMLVSKSKDRTEPNGLKSLATFAKTATLSLLAVPTMIVLSGQSAEAATGDAGCGLGSMVIQENTKVMQILAATTNGFTGTQIFGISSGTSNCKAQNLVMRDKAVQYFAEVNLDDLSREMAQGRGEKLGTLAALYGCNSSGKTQFARTLQKSYEKIIPAADTNAVEMVRQINHAVDSNSELNRACSLI